MEEATDTRDQEASDSSTTRFWSTADHTPNFVPISLARMMLEVGPRENFTTVNGPPTLDATAVDRNLKP